MSNSPDIQVDRITGKLQQLLKKYRQLGRENTQLKKELDRQVALAAEQQQQLGVLQRRSDAARLGAGALDTEEKAALRKSIDSYLKDIDRCLELLNTV